MSRRQAERRKYRRVYFAPDDGMVGYFRTGPEGSTAVKAQLMNISMSGMAFRVAEAGPVIKKGDVLTLTGIEGKLPITLTGEVKVIVRWTASDPLFERPVAGCEFVEIPLEMTDWLGKFIYCQDQ